MAHDVDYMLHFYSRYHQTYILYPKCAIAKNPLYITTCQHLEYIFTNEQTDPSDVKPLVSYSGLSFLFGSAQRESLRQIKTLPKHSRNNIYSLKLINESRFHWGILKQHFMVHLRGYRQPFDI